MYIDDAIIMAIIGGRRRFGKILSASEEMCKMSRATFNKHLKQLQKDQYIKQEINKKIIEYKINRKKIHELLEFKEDEKLDYLIENYKEMLESKGGILLRADAEQHLEETIHSMNQHIDICLLNQRRLTILINLKYFNTTLQKKCKAELKKYEISLKQTLELMEWISPEIRKDYEQFLLLKIHNENKSDITKIKKFKGTSLLKKFVKKYKKS